VVWEDGTLGNSEVLFRSNSDPFRDNINLSNNSGTSTGPRIASAGDNVYVVWEDNTLGNYEVFFRASHDSGRTFGNIINISNDSADSSQPPQIAAIGDNVYVVWRSFNIDNNDILFASSNDNGQTFITPVNLSNSPGDSQFARIAAAGDNVYVVWEDRPSGNADISYTVSNNSGLTFSPPINLSNSLGNSINPDISTSGDKVYVVWQDDTLGNFDIFFIAIDDNGITVGSKLN
jgi:hypothetical protein